MIAIRRSPRRAAERWWERQLREERLSIRAATALVSAGDTVIDIGADWGVFTGGLARLVGPAGTVHAFEPNPDDRNSLLRVRDGRPNVIVHHVALSDETGPAKLHVKRRDGRSINAMGTLSSPHAEQWQGRTTIEVSTKRLDDVLDPGAPIRFIKCDVEGHEYHVLRGASRTLERHRPALLIEIEQRHSRVPVSETFALIAGLGYDGYFLSPLGLRRLDEFDLDRDQLRLLADDGGVTDPVSYVNDFLFLPTSESGLRPGPVGERGLDLLDVRLLA